MNGYDIEFYFIMACFMTGAFGGYLVGKLSGKYGSLCMRCEIEMKRQKQQAIDEMRGESWKWGDKPNDPWGEN